MFPGAIETAGRRRAGLAALAVVALGLALTACKPAPGQFIEYPTHTASSSPWGITTGPDGKIWYVEEGNDTVTPHVPSALVKLDPADGTSTEYPLGGIDALGVTVGPDGLLWVSEEGTIESFDPATGQTAIYPIPGGGDTEGIANGPDDAVWFTEPYGNRVGRLDLATHVITTYDIPTPDTNPWSITEGSDGGMWFGAAYGAPGAIRRIDPVTKAITEFPLTGRPAGDTSPMVAAGPDGDVWFSTGDNSLGRIDPTTHAMTYLDGPANSAGGWTFGIAAGPDGNVWFTELSNGGTNWIGRATPAGVVTTYPIPSSASEDAVQITAGPDHDLWFAETLANKIATFAPPSS